jgi:heme exporter protein D
MDWEAFFHMGGYAFYVWSAWGLSFIVLTYLFTRAKQRNAKIRREIERQIRREALSKSGNDNDPK